MKAISNHLNSSQVSPRDATYKSRLDYTELYTSMMLEDFSRDYSIDFSPKWDDRDFYDILPTDDALREILTSPCYMDLEAIFSHLLTNLMQILIEQGKAYVEIITWQDMKGQIKGITFFPISYAFAIPFAKKVFFVSKLSNKKHQRFSIARNNLLKFDLRDLGYSRRHFRRILKKINKNNAVEVISMSLDKNLGIDFSKYAERAEYQLLKHTKTIYWYGRNNRNRFMGDYYLTWRMAKLIGLKKTFLDYFLKTINEGLTPFRAAAGFSGEIIAKCKDVDYSQDFEKLKKGELTSSEVVRKLTKR